MERTNVTILTDRRYIDPKEDSPYTRNILLEDQLVRSALEKKGLRVKRASWDDPGFDWSLTDFILFRSTWDYFDRFPEFFTWLERVRAKTSMLNPYEVIKWNLDKHYLEELAAAGINIPATLFIEAGDASSLASWVRQTDWKEVILKPVVSGAARHTYRFLSREAGGLEDTFRNLITEESMMIQEFQESVPLKGEVAFMVFGGKFTHSIIKKAKKGDFRVQDDFGGTVHHYGPSAGEIEFAQRVVGSCGYRPIYARVDAIWDNSGQMAVSELELIEPELWFRFCPQAADRLADAIFNAFF
jgi:glutathione synthase/RimK-type ligase-like ATP-grasp enzyme